MVARRLRDRRQNRRVIALVLASVVGVLACDAGDPALDIPTTLRTPELVGVVETVEARSGQPLVTLADGMTYDPTGATLIVHAGTLEAGSLLLAGTQPTPWYVHLLETAPGCYGLTVRGRDDGTTVVTELGLRLTKAQGFSAPHDPSGRYARPNDWFCLGPDGQVTGYGLNH
jgi:hypothetical protein